MPGAAWTLAQMAEPGYVTPAPEMGSCRRAAVNCTCQSLGLGLNPTAPAPALIPEDRTGPQGQALLSKA